MPEIQQGVGRAQYYDRNPVNQSKFYAAIVGPHASVSRWSYTVPTGKKAFYESALATISRQTAAAPVGFTRIIHELTPNGGGTLEVLDLFIQDNVIGADHSQRASGIGTLIAGDNVQSYTNDGSTVGTVYFDTTAKFMEYDA